MYIKRERETYTCLEGTAVRPICEWSVGILQPAGWDSNAIAATLGERIEGMQLRVFRSDGNVKIGEFAANPMIAKLMINKPIQKQV